MLSHTSFELSGGRVQRGLGPLWQGFVVFPETLTAGGLKKDRSFHV